MDRAQLALARHRTYGMLGELLADGVTAALEPVVAGIPAFRGTLHPDGDERAAEHQRVFGFEVPLFESAWREPTGCLGGEVGRRVSDLYAACGFHPGRHDLEPEHLALELALLAHLCLAEHEAVIDGRVHVADRMVALQRRALTEHVLRWLPAVVAAVRRVSSGFERLMVELALELAVSHVEDVAGEPAAVDDLLDRPETGLRHIAAWLATPARSGMYLTQSDLVRVAGEAGVPAGFDTRVKRLEALLHGARDLGTLPRLVGGLRGVVSHTRTQLGELEALGVNAADWRALLASTDANLLRLEAAL